MEYLKTQEYHTRIDVYFDGEKYVFINAFHGCVAVAKREGLVESLMTDTRLTSSSRSRKRDAPSVREL